MNNARIALEIGDRILRSWWVLVAGPCLGMAGAVAALHFLPKTFEASTTIFVAPQQIPQEFVRSTVTDDMSIRLASLREAVLSRPYLHRLVDQAFGGVQDAESLERLIQSVRARLEVRVIENARVERGRSGGVFQLIYRDEEPERAANVVNMLAEFYMDQNVRSRTAQAEGTTRTIQSLAEDVLAELQAQEREVAAFQGLHLYETEAHFAANVQLLQGRQQDLVVVDRDLAAAADRLQLLKTQDAQSALAAGTEADAALVLDPHTARLAQLRREYDALRARYHDEHPDVKAKKRELDDFIAADFGGSESGTEPGRTRSRPLTPLQAEIRSVEGEITRLHAEQTRLRGEIETYKRRIENTPRIEQQLNERRKGLDVLRDRYRDYQTKLEEAKGSERIEATQKGERFEVIERAIPPALPIRPVPAVLYALGLAVGLAVFVGPVALRAALVPRIGSEVSLREALGDVPVLVTVPRLPTAEITQSRRRRRIWNSVASAGSVAILAGVIVWLGIGR